MLRYILSHYTKHLPSQIEFTHNKYGKPFLQDNKENVQFNISHSHEWFCCIIAIKQQVGIDIEREDDNTMPIQELFNLVFTPRESQYMAAMESSKQLNNFYNAWTKKEALVKATGYGLSYPINTIEAMEISDDGKIVMHDNNNKIRKEWHCFSLEAVPNYSLAIAMEHKINQVICLELGPSNI